MDRLEAALRNKAEKPDLSSSPVLGRLMMGRPAGIEIVRRAYELWEQAGKPEGRDQEFYLQAERELQEAQDQPKETPEDI